MFEPVIRTVRCPHCASTDAAPSRPRLSIADAACRLAGYTSFRCRQCFERFFARSIPVATGNGESPAAVEPAPSAGPGEKKRNALRKELGKAKAALAEQQERTARAEKAASALREQVAALQSAPQRIADLQNDLAKATAVLEKETISAPDLAALQEELAAETERANRLEREAAHRAAAALLDRGQGGDRVAELEKELAENRMARESMDRDIAALREELATVRAAAATELSDAQSAVLAATERGDRLEKELAESRAAQEPVDAEALAAENRTLKEALARESERRAKLERDVRDLREGWAYDMARRRADSAGAR